MATLRPRLATIVRMNAAVSFSIFVFMMGSIGRPLPSTGCAAPALVPGAMAAMSAASRMKKPADAARAPAGPTKTITGTFDVISFSTMERVESSSPPGVVISMTTASECSLAARARPRSMNSSLIGWITSLRLSRRTSACTRTPTNSAKRTSSFFMAASDNAIIFVP